MDVIKREKWTEESINELPPGEHDYFERKSGSLFADNGALFGALAKAISAMANSGGGHIILGVDDNGVPDGVPPYRGSTPVREWLEQKIPSLVNYPLSNFRVHRVEKGSASRIPPDKEVIVIDIGDSSLAPHQCAHSGGGTTHRVYYYRQGGRSEPAPHFYLELLRQRLVSPMLSVTKVDLVPFEAVQVDGRFFLASQLRFEIENVGRVAAYKWELVVQSVEGCVPREEYRFNQYDYPSQINRISTGLSLDKTMLPGGKHVEYFNWGVFLNLSEREPVSEEMERKILPVVFGYRVATETSPGDVQTIELRTVTNIEKLGEFMRDRIN